MVIVTLGMFLALNSLVQLIFGTDPQFMPSAFLGRHRTVPATAAPPPSRRARSGLVLVLIAECLVLWFMLNRTKLGLKLRAVAANPDSARLHGIKAGSMLMLGWALSAAIGALAGSLVAAQRTGFDSNLMQTVLVYALAAAALGGFDSLWGAVICGIVVGVADALTIQYIDPLNGIEVVLPLALILVVLVVSPHGLFGKRTVEGSDDDRPDRRPSSR